MALSMYQASVPVFRKSLGGLSEILGKAAAHCEATKVEQSVLLNTRLFPDMFPLIRQVRQVTDQALGTARLAGQEPPKLGTDETTFEELRARIAKADDFLKSLTPAQVDGSEDKDIVLSLGARTVTFKGQFYLLHFAAANFWFHYTTAYNILRHCGVAVGKRDFLGAMS